MVQRTHYKSKKENILPSVVNATVARNPYRLPKAVPFMIVYFSGANK